MVKSHLNRIFLKTNNAVQITIQLQKSLPVVQGVVSRNENPEVFFSTSNE